MLLGLVGGLVVALVTVFKKHVGALHDAALRGPRGAAAGRHLADVRAAVRGHRACIAVGLTFGTLGALLLAYTSRLIKVTENFKLGIFAATGAIGLLYLVSMVLGFFGIRIPLIHESGIIGIGFSLFVVVRSPP